MDISNNSLFIKEENKRARKANAIKLPNSINENMIPKYVVYYRECYNKKNNLWREYFKIDRHPKVFNKNKVYISSKSNKITILEKLEQIKKILLEIENENTNGNENSDTNDNENSDTNSNENENTNSNENDSKQENEKIFLPKYFSYKNHPSNSKKYYLIYDKKFNDGTRLSCKSIFFKETDMLNNYKIFKDKVYSKFY